MPQELFTLRREHEEAFGRAGLDRFVRKTARLLRERQVPGVLEFEEMQLREFIGKLVAHARRHELVTERQMYSVCETAMRLRFLKTDLCSDPACTDILQTAQAPQEKAHALRSLVSEIEKSRTLPP